MPLQSILLYAYRVKTYQISAPSWLNAAKYDIVAKIPPGHTSDEFHVMLQNLLAEKFHMTIRHETRDVPGYELVLAKGGSKLKEASPPPASAPDGSPTAPNQFGLFTTALPNGLENFKAHKLPMERIVTMSESQTGKHIVDKTGLKGEYDFVLQFARNAMTATPAPGSAEEFGPDFPAALQSQLGLKLEPKNVPVDVMVIDQVDKQPIENE